MNRAKLLPLSIQPGSRETLQTPEPLTSPTEAPRFYFSFINSGCYWYEQGVEGRREQLQGRRYVAVYAIIIPTLLVMMIILLRE